VALLVVTLPYVWLSAQDWSGDFKQRVGLDGEAFIAQLSPGDAAAIAWVRAHAHSGDTLVEAPGCSYGVIDGVPMNRVSAFTGVPAIVGWDFHERQWRRGEEPAFDDLLNERIATAGSLLDGSTDPDSAPSGLEFLILGRQETRQDASCRLTVSRDDDTVERLEQDGWELAFDASGTRVFARLGHNLGSRDVSVEGRR